MTGGRPRGGRRSSRLAVLARGLLTATLGVSPVFLVGASAVGLVDDLEATASTLGTFAAVFFVTCGLLGKACGDLIQHLGSDRGLVLAPLVSTVALLLIGSAPTVWLLMAAAVVGGLGHGLAQPAVNDLLAIAIRPGRLGLAFGIKQSSVPLASMLGGLSVPLLALTLGWRTTFIGGAALCVVVAGWSAAARRLPLVDQRDASRKEPRPRREMVLLTLGYACGAAAATSLGVFFVSSAVASGLDGGSAGFTLSACAVLGVLGRIFAGWLCDTRPGLDAYLLIAALLASGSVGYLLLGVATNLATFAVGAVLAYSAGFSWPGVFHYAIVRDSGGAAASATGFAQTGSSLGAALGPLVVGVCVSRLSYGAGWLALAAFSLAGAVLVRHARRPRGQVRQPGN